MCCATRRVDFPDECSPDGLCRNGGDIYRDDCTDPTWKSTGCVQLCTTGFGETGEDVGNPEGQRASAAQTPSLHYLRNAAKLTHCGDGSYCCGVRNMTCCAQGHGKRIANIIVDPNPRSSPGTAAGSRTFHPSGAPTATAVTSKGSAGNSERHPIGLSLKDQIAIAVSCVIVGTLVAAFIAGCIMRRKERAGSDDTAGSEGATDDKCIKEDSIHEAPALSIRQELWEREPYVELVGTMRVELHA
ncbi:hypothetical protein G7Y79_00034g069030 [Physcia stellaris]|nr:hypothetical protein G7Y79_00034g069030 [Physcia stellaris]